MSRFYRSISFSLAFILAFSSEGMVFAARALAPRDLQHPPMVGVRIPSLEAGLSGTASAFSTDQPLAVGADLSVPLPYAARIPLGAQIAPLDTLTIEEPDIPRLRSGSSKHAPRRENTVQEHMRAARAVLKAGKARALGAWEFFWQGTRPLPSSPDALPAATEGLGSAPLLKRPAIGLHAVPMPPPSPREVPQAAFFAWSFGGSAATWGPTFSAALPYLKAGGAVLGTLLLIRLAGRALDGLWSWKKWDRNVLIKTRFLTQIGLGIVGVSTALEVGGVQWNTAFASLGLSGVLVGIPLKEFLENPIKYCILRPNWHFDIGRRLRLKEQEYTIIDSTFDGLVLRAKEGEYTLLSYAQILSNVIELFIEPNRADASTGQEPVSKASAPKHSSGANWALLALLGVALKLSLLGGALWIERVLPWLAPYMRSCGVLLCTWVFERILHRFLLRSAINNKWNLNLSSRLSLALSSMLYALGIGVALHLAGLSVTPLLTSLGILGVALGVALGGIMGNLATSLRILRNKPFLIGDSIVVAGKQGTVADITYTFVVLKAAASSGPQTILIPHAVLKDSMVTVLKSYIPPTQRYER